MLSLLELLSSNQSSGNPGVYPSNGRVVRKNAPGADKSHPANMYPWKHRCIHSYEGPVSDRNLTTKRSRRRYPSIVSNLSEM